MKNNGTTEYAEAQEGEARSPACRGGAILFGGLALSLVAVLARWHSYLLFHTVVELFAVFIALGVFVIAWNTRRYQRTGYLLFLGIAYLYVGAVDFVHTFAYRGMGLFPGYDADLPTQLWIAGRMIESVALLLAPLFLRRRLRPGAAMTTFAVVTAIAVGAAFLRVFPACYVEGHGLTLFKTLCEYAVCIVLLAAGVETYRHRSELEAKLVGLLLWSIGLTVVSELAFTLYVDVYGGLNMLGHLLKLASYLLIYVGLVDGALRRPWELIFRDLERSRKFYRELFEHLTSGVAVYEAVQDGADFVIKEINAAGERITQVDRNEILGKRLLEVFPSAREMRLVETLQRVWRSGRAESMSTSYYADNRLQIWVDNNVYRLPSGEVAAVFDDLTSRKQMEEALLQRQKLAAVGTLACGMGHEINNPIMGIINYAQLIKDGLQGRDGNLEEFAGEIAVEAERIAGIVRGLSAFATRDIATRAAVPVSDLFESALSATRDTLTHDRIALEVDLPDNLPGVVCDRGQIAQVLTSLLSNASDALNERYPGHDGNRIIRVMARDLDTEQRTLNTERVLRITVEDHGTGIPLDVREHIFEPFFTTKDKSVGAGSIAKGLGLFVSHAVVQEHGGALSVDSEPGHWTRFHLDLPVSAG